VNLGELVAAIVDQLEPLLLQHEATLHNHISLNLAALPLDPVQIQRVFENLLANALQHNARGLTLTLSAALVEDKETQTIQALSLPDPSEYSSRTPFILCRIQDNGVGMTQEECDSLFDRYTRGNYAHRSTGIGLGLYLCRQIITAHGGQIGALSSPGNGATFWFSLPL
jgi:signal transduction histidine kinase